MASGPIVGDGARERQRYTESKVYTRKAFKAPRRTTPLRPYTPTRRPQTLPPTTTTTTTTRTMRTIGITTTTTTRTRVTSWLGPRSKQY
ncbi:hypothetical protein SLA2020_268470 [Shorea laevis]